MLKQSAQWLVEWVQKGLNQYLLLDPYSSQRLQCLENKTVRIELLGLGVHFYLSFVATGIQCQLSTEDQQRPVDTVIKGTPLRLLHLSLTPANRKQFFADDVIMQGNLDVGQQVVDLFDHLDIDWEEHASRVIGDTPAHFIGKTARKLKQWGQQTRDSFRQNVNEFIHEEIPLFPPAEALQDFFHDVDHLRMDVDRLEARIHHLQRTLKRGQE